MWDNEMKKPKLVNTDQLFFFTISRAWFEPGWPMPSLGLWRELGETGFNKKIIYPKIY